MNTMLNCVESFRVSFCVQTSESGFLNKMFGLSQKYRKKLRSAHVQMFHDFFCLLGMNPFHKLVALSNWGKLTWYVSEASPKRNLIEFHRGSIAYTRA